MSKRVLENLRTFNAQHINKKFLFKESFWKKHCNQTCRSILNLVEMLDWNDFCDAFNFGCLSSRSALILKNIKLLNILFVFQKNNLYLIGFYDYIPNGYCLMAATQIECTTAH